MTENINNNVNLLVVKDGKMKESLERLLIISEEISLNDEKIKFQDEEMVKTQKLIDYYKDYYEKQNFALEHFCNERKRLSEENVTLIAMLNSLQREETSNNMSRKHFNSDSNTENTIIKKLKLEDTANCDSASKIQDFNLFDDIPNLKEENMIEILKKLKAVRKKKIPIVVSPKKNIVISKTNIEISNVFKAIQKVKKNSKIKSTELKKKTPKVKISSADINVTLKVPATPLNKLFSVDKKYKIHKILISSEDSIVCGNHGLLSNSSKTRLMNYRGHDDFYIYNFYVYNNELVSIAYNYILVHNILNADYHKLISSFTSPISCTYLHKSILYGALQDGVMFFVDLCDHRVRICDRIFPTLPKAMAVVKHADSINLVIGMLNGDIRRYDLSDELPRGKDIGKVDGVLRGIVNCANIMVCYTDHRLYFIDRTTWRLSLIRETSNSITHVDASFNKVMIIDSCNILHRYIIKKGKIRVGSTIESLPLTGNISALHVNETEKKIVLSCLSEVYQMKL